MNNPLMVTLIIESAVMVFMLVVLFWLVRTQLKLKHDYRTLSEVVHGHGNDIAGLCSAALKVDTRIASVDRQVAFTDEQINDLVVKLAEAEQNEQSAHPYSVDIRKVRSGASVNELMQNSGLSHDEAALLIRLHGSKAQS
jgi:hypothetical protein